MAKERNHNMPQQRAVEDPLHSVNSVATVRSATMIGRSWRCGLLQEIPSESLNIARFHEPDFSTQFRATIVPVVASAS